MNSGPSLIYTVSSRLGQPELQENFSQIKFKSVLQQIPIYKAVKCLYNQYANTNPLGFEFVLAVLKIETKALIAKLRFLLSPHFCFS